MQLLSAIMALLKPPVQRVSCRHLPVAGVGVRIIASFTSKRGVSPAQVSIEQLAVGYALASVPFPRYSVRDSMMCAAKVRDSLFWMRQRHGWHDGAARHACIATKKIVVA